MTNKSLKPLTVLRNKGQQRRETLFNIFTKNLASVKRHPNLQIIPEFEDGIICPLCFKLFTREALSKKFDDHLTLEDVPPLSLGGQPLLLTCKPCNNTAGSQLDVHLKRKLNMDEFLSGTPGVEIKTRFRPAPGIKILATTQFTPEGTINLQCIPEGSKPDNLQLLKEMTQSDQLGNFSLDFLPGHKINRPEISLIRIAYLMAFAKFGYGFLINPAIHLVRQQIQSPKEKLLSDWGIIPCDFTDDFLGVNLLDQPEELQGFLVVFDLRTSNSTTRHAIVLPGPSYPAVNIYQNLSDIRNKIKPQSITFSIRVIPDLDYLGNPDLAFASHYLWDNCRSKKTID